MTIDSDGMPHILCDSLDNVLDEDDDDLLASFDFGSADINSTLQPNDGVVQPNDVDALAANDLAKLSITDREKVYHDIHGVSNEIKETPEFVQEHLLLFEMRLPLVPESDSKAYLIAQSSNPDYVRNLKLRLRFLRCDRFDIDMAVKRFLLHFEVKLDLFGRDLLVKDIDQDDLDEEAQWMLNNKVAFDLPVRDMGGRLAFFMTNSPNVTPPSLKALHQRSFYMIMVFTEDEATQRKGIVSITYNVEQTINWRNLAFQRSAIRKWAQITAALPWRVEAFHLCADSFFWRPMYALFRLKVSMFSRVRVREHYGTHKEVLFNLQTYGIPTQHLNVKEGSYEELIKQSRERWRKRRTLECQLVSQKAEASKESCSQSTEMPVRVVTPGQYDVLLGRGKAFYDHPGNQRLKYLILERLPYYERAGYSEKSEVCGGIVDLINSKLGRFLKDDGAGWVEVDDKVARNKVGHLFRQLRRKGSVGR